MCFCGFILCIDQRFACCAGERNLYALSEIGQMLFMKKFNFNPLCFLPYSGMYHLVKACFVDILLADDCSK